MTEFGPDCWRVTGPLTVKEVPGHYATSRARRHRDGMPSRVDLSGVESTDSSALALLLEWLSWARSSGAALEFDHPPDSLRVIAELCDAGELLGWAGK